MKRILFFLTLTIMSTDITAQNLNTHQWENRVILIVSNTKESKLYQDQIKEFKKSQKDLTERKLVVYYVLPNQHKFNNFLNATNIWIPSSDLYEKFANNHENFNIILIGLDSGIKVEQSTMLTTVKLFETIDSMPMRQSELRQKTNDN